MMYKVTVVFKDSSTPDDVKCWATKDTAARVAADYRAGRGPFLKRHIDSVTVSEIDEAEVLSMSKSKEYDELWRTQDGRVLRVCDMTDDHVRATLNMLLENRRKRRALKKDLKKLEDWIEESLSDDAKWGNS